jgi:uncharacterized protein YjbJ (UPF0337 family)
MKEWRMTMNWDSIEGRWKQRRGKAVFHWGKTMNDELAAVAGKHEELVGKLQEKYGKAKEEVRKQVEVIKGTVGQLKKANIELVKLRKELDRNTELEKKSMKLNVLLRKKVRIQAIK